MDSAPLTVDFDSPFVINDIKDAVEAHFTGHKLLLNGKISITSSSESASSTLFSSSEVKSILQKVASSKFWTKSASSNSLQPLKQLPLLPVIVPSSKLYLNLFPNGEHSLINNSFEVFKNIHHAYEEFMKFSQVPTKTKTAIETQKTTILGDTLTFTSNTLARLFVRSSDSDIFMEMFMRENYYTTVNIIRVFEFSILDLLKLPEKYQSSLVTPIETELANWKSSSSYDSALLEAFFKSALLASYKTVYGITLTDAEIHGSYPSEVLQRRHLELQKSTVQDHLFLCGNHESCKKREFKPKTFAKCSKCKWTRYCSSECQLAHWKLKHKTECGKPLTVSDADALFKGRRIIIGAEGDANTASSSASPSQ